MSTMIQPISGRTYHCGKCSHATVEDAGAPLALGNTKLDVGNALPLAVAVAVGRNARQVVKTTTSPPLGELLACNRCQRLTD